MKLLLPNFLHTSKKTWESLVSLSIFSFSTWLFVCLSVFLYVCMYEWQLIWLQDRFTDRQRWKMTSFLIFEKKWFSNQSDLLLGSQTSLIFYLVLKLVWSFTWFSNLSDLLLCSQTSLIFYLVLKLVWSFTWFSNYSDLLLGSQTCLSN